MNDELRISEASADIALLTCSPELSELVQYWAVYALRPAPLPVPIERTGVMLLRTGGHWDYGVSFSLADRKTIRPILVLKNAIPLWQFQTDLKDGRLAPSIMSAVGRSLVVHNPGLAGAWKLILDMASERLQC